MRTLNKKQKNYIDKLISNGTTSTEELPPEIYNFIENMNPHETFWSNLQRYITDKNFDRIYNKRIIK